MKPITNKRYPKCSAAGLLRQTKDGLVVSSQALYELWGNKRYQETIPLLTYCNHGGWLPASVEKHL